MSAQLAAGCFIKKAAKVKTPAPLARGALIAAACQEVSAEHVRLAATELV
jgi:hypothetical protein